METLEEWPVFLASPGDIIKERAAVQKIVDDINRTIGRQRRVHLRLVSWENDTFPAYGNDPQQIVNQQIAEMATYKLFIGIMWNRLGTRTPRDLSGTVEEFHRAVESLTIHGRPEIWFYFRDSAARLNTSEQLEQRSGVLAFKKEISSKGIIRDYKDFTDFSDKVRNHLLLWLEKVPVRAATAGPSKLENADASQMAKPVSRPTTAAQYEIQFDQEFRIVSSDQMLEFIIDEAIDAQRNKRKASLSISFAEYSEAKKQLQQLLSAGTTSDEQKQQIFELRQLVRRFSDRAWGHDIEELVHETLSLFVLHVYPHFENIKEAARCLRHCFGFIFGAEHPSGERLFDLFRDDLSAYFVIGLTKEETNRLMEKENAEEVSWLTRIWGLDSYDFYRQWPTQGFPGMFREYFRLKQRREIDPKEFFAIQKWKAGLH